jgi:hypothetical protein
MTTRRDLKEIVPARDGVGQESTTAQGGPGTVRGLVGATVPGSDATAAIRSPKSPRTAAGDRWPWRSISHCCTTLTPIVGSYGTLPTSAHPHSRGDRVEGLELCPVPEVVDRIGACGILWVVGTFPVKPRAAAAFSTEGAIPAAGRAGPREQGVQWGGREHHNRSPARNRRLLVVAVDRLRQLACNSSEIGRLIVAKLLRRSGRVEMQRPALCLRYGGDRVITGRLCGVSKVLRLCFASV